MEDGGLTSQSPSPPLSGGSEFYKEGGETEQRDQGGGGFEVLYVQTSTVHSNKASDSLVCIVLVSSSWLHAILDPWKSLRAGMPEGQSVSYEQLVPRILTQTCCSSTSCILVRISTYRNDVRRMVGWVLISHHYNFPRLHKECCGLGLAW